MQETIKPPVEVRYQEELEALKKADEEQGNKKTRQLADVAKSS